MIPAAQQQILKKLSTLCDLSPGVRFGQLAAHLDFLATDMFDRGLGEIDDDHLLQVLERHEQEMSRRQSSVA